MRRNNTQTYERKLCLLCM